MIHLPASGRVYLCLTACDMRKSFDGRHTLVREHLEWDPFAGHLFVFVSRRRDRVKILYWDQDGFAIWSKRLERGTYAAPFGNGEGNRREITVHELVSSHPERDRPGRSEPPQALPALAIKTIRLHFVLGRDGSSEYTMANSWPSIPNTFRMTRESCNRWCWI